MTGRALPVLAVCGLLAEARIAAGAGIVTLAGGGDAARLALQIESALAQGVIGLISIGIAGGLVPGLRPGGVVVARAVRDGEIRRACDAAWTRRLGAVLEEAMLADIAGVDQPLCGAPDKAALHAATGAVAVDMESHVVARLAGRHGLPFAVLRVVADPAERGLPAAAVVGLRPDGSSDVGAVLRALARRPADLPALIRTALDARAAFAALSPARRQLGARLGFDEAPRDPNRDDGLLLEDRGARIGLRRCDPADASGLERRAKRG